nr:MAG TPA: hypothetical protein [Caudoviricetes sp.]
MRYGHYAFLKDIYPAKRTLKQAPSINCTD